MKQGGTRIVACKKVCAGILEQVKVGFGEVFARRFPEYIAVFYILEDRVVGFLIPSVDAHAGI